MIAFAVDGRNIQRSAESIARYSGFETVKNLNSLAEEVAKEALIYYLQNKFKVACTML